MSRRIRSLFATWRSARRRRKPAGRQRRTALELLEPRQLLAADLVITEFMANNNGTLADSDGNFSDWIEIHNPGDASINLIDWSLTDDANNLDKWQFPYLNIEPGGYQVVFASGKDRSYDSYRLTTDLHTTPDGTFLIDLPEGTYDIRLTLGDTKRIRDNVEIQLQGERVDTVSTDAGEFVAKTYSADVTSATSSQLAIRLVDLGGVTSRAAIGAMIITSASGEEVGRFDFGKESSALEPGFTQVTTSSIYSAGAGFGWKGSADFVISSPDRGLTADQPHTNFKLSSRGEYVALVSPEGTVVFEHGPEGADFPLQFPDVSYGVPNDFTPLLRDDASFSYLVPTAAEAALGTSWTERGFDDTSWTRTDSVGLSEGIGFANHTKFDGLFATDIADVMQSVNGSVWIRQEFDIADPAAVAGLRLDVQFDDGLVAFLNGVEVTRAIAPDELAWDSVATEGRLQDASVWRFFLGTGSGRLVAGTNVLAIQGLNRNAVDPDFLIRPQLLAASPIDFTTAPVGVLDSPSPGSPNSLLRSATVTFDHENGIFDTPFLLGLSVATPGATIRYTTDGSVPTEESPLYNDAEPLAIASTAFVQAIAFAPDFAPSTVSNAWFSKIDVSLEDFSSNLPVVTLENFDTGEPASKVPNFQLHAFSLFEPDGDTGRTTLTGTPTIETRAGIKVRGSSTASQPKRSFALEAWDERNEDTDIAPLGMPANSDWVLFAAYNFDRALMRNPLAYELSNQVGRYAVRTRFVELYLNSDGGDLAADDYRGVYVLMEKIKLGKDRVDITELSPGAATEPDVTGGWILKVDRNDQGDRGFSAGGQGFLHNDAQLLNFVDPKEDDVTSAQRAWISNFINEMAASLGNSDRETGYPSYIDVDSWIDHHILNYLPMNVDGFRLSGYMFKDRDGKLEMGPVWDFDRSMESIDGRDDRPSVFEGPWDTSVFFSNDGRHPWWGQLFDNADFRQRWTDRWFELRKTVFSEENVTSIIDSMAAQLGEAQQRNFARWPAVAPRSGAAYRSDRLDGTWQGEVEHMKAWLMERLAWTDAQFVDPPRATPDSGPLVAGAEVELSVDEGTIYYTTDGTDPRLPDGQINPSATVYNPTVTLVDANSDAQTLVPSDDTLTGWQSVGFDDSSWDSGRASLGFDAGSPTAPIDVPDGFTVREVHSIGQVVGLARADALLGGLNISSETTVSGVPVINYLDGTVDHRFGSNLPMPAEGGNQIVIQATASVVVEEEGTYTFGINAVKGARLRIDGEDLIVSETSLGRDAFGTLTLTAGTHALELTVFQDPKTTPLGDRNLSVELFVAPGTHDAFSDAFALLGDGDKPFGTQILTDVAEAMQDTSASLYARMPFQIEDPADVQRLTLRMQVDDGFVAYLNGVEVARRNAPPQPTFDATATRERADYLALRQETIDLSSFQRLLNDGSNVLAIHALNRSAADSDFLVVPELSMVRFGDPIVAAEPIVLQARTWRDGQWSAPATGSQNDILINEILARSGESDPDRIELLNTTDRPIELSGWLLTDDSTDVGRYPIPAGTTIDAGGYLSLSSTETGFQMDGQQGGQVWLVQPAAEARAMRFVDTVRFDGSAPGVSLGRWPDADSLSPLFPMTSQTFGEENSGPALGDVIISEVDYQPRLPASVPSITSDYMLEFVELFGRSDTPVNLNGWQIDGGVLFTFTEDIELSEGQAVVLVGFDPAEAARADEFRQVLEIDQSVRLVGPYVGRLGNGGEQLRLLRPLAGVNSQQGVALVDSLAYDNQSPWPTKAAGGGLSLHRTAEDAFGGFVSSFRPLTPSPGEEPFIMAGDLDLDGAVDAGDVAGFVLALNDPDAYEAAFGVSVLHGGDLDHDGDVDYDDIQGLVAQLAASAAEGTATGRARVGVVAVRDHGLVSDRRSAKQRHGRQDDLTGKPRQAHWATLADRALKAESIWRNGE